MKHLQKFNIWIFSKKFLFLGFFAFNSFSAWASTGFIEKEIMSQVKKTISSVDFADNSLLAQIDTYTYTAMKAYENNQTSAVKSIHLSNLLRAKAEFATAKARYYFPFKQAVYLGDYTAVVEGIKKDVPINEMYNDKTALDIAKERGFSEIEELLKSHGALTGQERITKEKEYQLHSKIELGNIESVKKLLFIEGINPNVKERLSSVHSHNHSEKGTPLHSVSIYNGNLKIAKLLIKAGANINEKSSAGRTALIVASEHGLNSKLIKFYLKNGADITVTDNWGRFALNNAVRNQDLKTVKLIMPYYAYVSTKTALEQLQQARQTAKNTGNIVKERLERHPEIKKRASVISYFISDYINKANISKQDYESEKPLYLTSRNKNLERPILNARVFSEMNLKAACRFSFKD